MSQPAIHPPTVNIFRVIAQVACAVMLALGLLDMMELTPQRIQQAAAGWSALPMLAMQLARLSGADGAEVPQLAYWGLLNLFVLLGLLFALALWLRTSPQLRRSSRLDAGLLAVQVLIAVLLEPWTEPGLVYLVAAELAFILPFRAALACLLTQIALVDAASMPLLLHVGEGRPQCNVAGTLPPPALVMGWMGWLEGMAFQGFAFCVGYFASAEMRSRMALEEAHEELVASQLLLADTVRTAERGRIARNLHDVVGQRLIALNAQLGMAMCEVGAKAVESVRTAHEMAQRLLAEVRVVVSADREPHAIDLRQALQTLCSGIPAPRISLSFDPELDLSSPLLAHTIFRSVQEAVSNTVRHSGASLLQIALFRMHGGVAISICDDGRGMRKGIARQVLAGGGNGLRGMRERIEEQAGRLVTDHPVDGGFSLLIWLPQAGALK
jgi:signal transduction histidine kinase